MLRFVLLGLIAIFLAVHAPAAQAKKRKRFERPVQPGRHFGEDEGPARRLAQAKGASLFRCAVRVDQYAVLAVTAAGIVLRDVGLEGNSLLSSKHAKAERTDGHVVVLTQAKGPGRVRVVPPVHGAGAQETLIEIDDRDVEGASTYELTGAAVRALHIDALHAAPADAAKVWKEAVALEASSRRAEAARKWIWIATHTRDVSARLWAIEKYCMLQPYPGAKPSLLEQRTLRGYEKAGPMEALLGHNMIFSWPEAYAAHTPIRHRFLAEVDIAMEWLRVWTNADQVRKRGKRMIARFRNDKSGTAIYVDFRLHIPRKHMRGPPDHEPYSHEAAHGYTGFGAISPTGTWNEALTEVGRTAYWHFLGIDAAWKPFRAICLESLANHHARGGTLENVKGYGLTAGVYFRLLDACCPGSKGAPDWRAWTPLFDRARTIAVPKGASKTERFTMFAAVIEAQFGKRGRRVLEEIGLPGAVNR